MEWKPNDYDKSELEKTAAEYAKEALLMSKRATPVAKPAPAAAKPINAAAPINAPKPVTKPKPIAKKPAPPPPPEPELEPELEPEPEPELEPEPEPEEKEHVPEVKPQKHDSAIDECAFDDVMFEEDEIPEVGAETEEKKPSFDDYISRHNRSWEADKK